MAVLSGDVHGAVNVSHRNQLEGVAMHLGELQVHYLLWPAFK